MFSFFRTTLAVLAVVIPASAANAQFTSTDLKTYTIAATSTHPATTVAVEYLMTRANKLTPKPTVGVILMPGGNGVVSIDHTTLQPGPALKDNFLVRNRGLFAQKGVMVALVDWAPTGALTHDTRLSKGHADVISKLIENIRKDPTYGVSRLWLVGTSSSTFSVANTAANYPKQAVTGPTLPPTFPSVNDGRPDGVVLTSTLTTIQKSGPTTCMVTIDRVLPTISTINVPAYVVWNKTDLCGCSPGAPPAIPQSVVTKLGGDSVRYPQRIGQAYNGPGDLSVADQCTAKTAHGFLGIDDAVVTSIVQAVTTLGPP